MCERASARTHTHRVPNPHGFQMLLSRVVRMHSLRPNFRISSSVELSFYSDPSGTCTVYPGNPPAVSSPNDTSRPTALAYLTLKGARNCRDKFYFISRKRCSECKYITRGNATCLLTQYMPEASTGIAHCIHFPALLLLTRNLNAEARGWCSLPKRFFFFLFNCSRKLLRPAA